MDAAVHPFTKEIIPMPVRMAAFTPVNIPICEHTSPLPAHFLRQRLTEAKDSPGHLTLSRLWHADHDIPAEAAGVALDQPGTCPLHGPCQALSPCSPPQAHTHAMRCCHVSLWPAELQHGGELRQPFRRDGRAAVDPRVLCAGSGHVVLTRRRGQQGRIHTTIYNRVGQQIKYHRPVCAHVTAAHAPLRL